MLVLLIIDFARVSSGALVHVVATAVEEVVGLAHALELFIGHAVIPPIWQPWRVLSSEDRRNGRVLLF